LGIFYCKVVVWSKDNDQYWPILSQRKRRFWLLSRTVLLIPIRTRGTIVRYMFDCDGIVQTLIHFPSSHHVEHRAWIPHGLEVLTQFQDAQCGYISFKHDSGLRRIDQNSFWVSSIQSIVLLQNVEVYITFIDHIWIRIEIEANWFHHIFKFITWFNCSSTKYYNYWFKMLSGTSNTIINYIEIKSEIETNLIIGICMFITSINWSSRKRFNLLMDLHSLMWVSIRFHLNEIIQLSTFI
jgi:hypothetical protein